MDPAVASRCEGRFPECLAAFSLARIWNVIMILPGSPRSVVTQHISPRGYESREQAQPALIYRIGFALHRGFSQSPKRKDRMSKGT
jgi:hypothetical protein